MANQPKNRAWLQSELAKKLAGWEPLMIESLVDTITGNQPRSEIDDVVQNFLAGETAAIAVVNAYFVSKEAASAGWQQYKKDSDVTSTKGSAEASSGSARQQQQQPEKVLGMFKQGGRLPKPPAASSGSGAGSKGAGKEGSKASTVAQLERKVVNCLGCGKIYDCRVVTNDIVRFLDRGGVCTFCGSKVALTYSDRAAQQEQAATAATASSAPGTDDATAAAVAFKDRLVSYDRNSQKRTTVIDDQSDYFEIDTNAWLTDQERSELRRRRQMEEEAAEAKKNRYTVTIDLIGRRVMVPEASKSSSGFETSSSMAAARAEAAAEAAAAAASAAAADASAAASSSTRVPAGPPATAEELSKAVAALRNMKMTINPNFAATPPVFLPGSKAAAGGAAGSRTAPGAAAAAAGGRIAAGRTGPGAAVPGKQQPGSRSGASGAAAAAAQAGRRAGPHSQRLQGDLFEEFDEFGMEVMYEDAAAAAAAYDAQPFDLCPPEFSGMQPLTAPTLAKRLQLSSPQEVPTLPRGMTLLRGFLDIPTQAALVSELRTLGLGPGGFYTPSYGTGAQLHLRMMCLGKHWEPRTHSYQDTRSSYDGAVPPPVPASVTSLSKAIITAAEQASGYAQPGPFTPDVCLVNFYEGKGRLGYHQDKDETSESLRKGLPVVSISIGDAADFMFGNTADELLASTLRLESGDALVFGGPARMVFHAVPRIYPGTAPQELLAATGLRPGRLNLTLRKV